MRNRKVWGEPLFAEATAGHGLSIRAAAWHAPRTPNLNK
jgi:hypothetical protein